MADAEPAPDETSAAPPPENPVPAGAPTTSGFEIEGASGDAGAAPPPPPGFPAPSAAPPAPKGPHRESPFVFGLLFSLRHWRALLVIVAAQLAFGLSIALPFRARVGADLDRHVRAAAFAGAPDEMDRKDGWDAGLDWGVWQDVQRKEAPFLDGLSLAIVWVGLLAWLFGQAVAGGVLASAAEDAGLAAPVVPEGMPRGRVARFLSGAGRWFFPMLRVSLVFLVIAMLLARRAIFEAWGGIAGDAEAKAASQASAWWGQRWREGTFLALFLVLRAAADLGRAHLVVRGRRSAFFAFFRGFWTLLRHPVKAGGLALLVGIPEMALLFGVADSVSHMGSASAGPLVGAFVLFQVAVWIRWTARATLLAGNVRLLQR